MSTCAIEDVIQRGSWVPPVDIYETEGHDLVIKAELPDMTREAIEVTVENNTLTLKGTKNPPAEVKDEQFRRSERHYGAFIRSFTLPTTVDASKVAAEYRNGVLTREAAVSRGSEAAHHQRRSRGVMAWGQVLNRSFFHDLTPLQVRGSGHGTGAIQDLTPHVCYASVYVRQQRRARTHCH